MKLKLAGVLKDFLSTLNYIICNFFPPSPRSSFFQIQFSTMSDPSESFGQQENKESPAVEEFESDLEDFEDLIKENELESASDWTNDDETRPICLFCELTFDDADAVWSHCALDHSFDYNTLRRGLGKYISYLLLDTYRMLTIFC